MHTIPRTDRDGDPWRARAVALVVGGLSALTGTLYVWVVFAAARTEPGAHVGPLWTWIVFVAANTLSAGLLRWHRSRPIPVFVAVFVVFVASSLVLGSTGNGALTLPMWFGVFAVAAYAPTPAGLLVTGVGWAAGTALKVGLAFADGEAAAQFLPALLPAIGLTALDLGFFFISCFVLGLGFRLQRQRAHDAAERARLVEERSRALNAEAVARERNRMARDLHDLAAHEIMDVLLSIRALRITGDDPVLLEVEEKTSHALNSTRAVVRALREADDDAPDRACLGESARRLIATLARERGVAVEARIAVSEPVDEARAQATLSVLKEALLNAAAHAPGQTVDVVLAVDGAERGRALTLAVRNPIGPAPGDTAGTGYGLVGAAERVALLDGSFEAGRDPGGVWRVSLRLPLADRPTSPPAERQAEMLAAEEAR